MNEENENKNSKAWGISSLVTGILSLLMFLMPYIGLPLGIFAIVAKYKQDKIKNIGMGTAGMICGILGIVINGIMLIFLLLALLIAGSLGGL